MSGQVRNRSGQVGNMTGQVRKLSGQVRTMQGHVRNRIMSVPVRNMSGQVRNRSGQAKNMSGQVRNMSGQVRNMSDQTRNTSGQIRNVSSQVRSVSGQVSNVIGQSKESIEVHNQYCSASRNTEDAETTTPEQINKTESPEASTTNTAEDITRSKVIHEDLKEYFNPDISATHEKVSNDEKVENNIDTDVEKIIAESKRHKCPLCEFKAIYVTDVWTHMKTIHSNLVPPQLPNNNLSSLLTFMAEQNVDLMLVVEAFCDGTLETSNHHQKLAEEREKRYLQNEELLMNVINKLTREVNDIKNLLKLKVDELPSEHPVADASKNNSTNKPTVPMPMHPVHPRQVDMQPLDLSQCQPLPQVQQHSHQSLLQVKQQSQHQPSLQLSQQPQHPLPQAQDQQPPPTPSPHGQPQHLPQLMALNVEPCEPHSHQSPDQ